MKRSDVWLGYIDEIPVRVRLNIGLAIGRVLAPRLLGKFERNDDKK